MLKYCLENNEGVKDCMLQVFNGRDNGFSHVSLSLGGNDDDGAADRVGGKKKNVTSNNFLEEEFGGGGVLAPTETMTKMS